MSLINDALKRASQSDRNRPPPAALLGRMEPAAAPRRSPLSWMLAGMVVAALALALAGWFFWKGWGASHSTATAAPAIPGKADGTGLGLGLGLGKEKPPPNPNPVLPKTAAVPPPPAPVVAPAPAPASAPAPAPAPAADEPWPIDLTVKAIFYIKSAPRARSAGERWGRAIKSTACSSQELRVTKWWWNGTVTPRN